MLNQNYSSFASKLITHNSIAGINIAGSFIVLIKGKISLTSSDWLILFPTEPNHSKFRPYCKFQSKIM